MRRTITVVTALTLVALFGYAVSLSRPGLPELPQLTLDADCVVEADGEVRLDRDQMANAATITATAVRLEMPERAAVVALATALQESKLRNLPHLGAHNDHDSIGLFQQRPSQGWGSEEQVSDPRYAAELFYRALAGVDGWEGMRLTDAAQRVQRSAFPEAYQKWAADATVLATALLGRAGGAVACRVDGEPVAPAAATAVRDELIQDWGRVAVTAGADDTWLQVAAGDPQVGWRYAHWLVSHAGALGLMRVHFGNLEWHAGSGIWQAAATVVDHVRGELTPEG
jgi:hypothetical protein